MFGLSFRSHVEWEGKPAPHQFSVRFWKLSCFALHSLGGYVFSLTCNAIRAPHLLPDGIPLPSFCCFHSWQDAEVHFISTVAGLLLRSVKLRFHWWCPHSGEDMHLLLCFWEKELTSRKQLYRMCPPYKLWPNLRLSFFRSGTTIKRSLDKFSTAGRTSHNYSNYLSCTMFLYRYKYIQPQFSEVFAWIETFIVEGFHWRYANSPWSLITQALNESSHLWWEARKCKSYRAKLCNCRFSKFTEVYHLFQIFLCSTFVQVMGYTLPQISDLEA